jgi:hypothetical protein
MTRTVLGLDPGKAGAAVLLVGDDHAVLEFAPIVGGKKWEAVHPQLVGWLRTMHATYRIDLAVLELHAGRPKEGGGSARACGIGWGMWLGALSGLGIEVRTPTSARWQAIMLADLAGEGKDRAISLCQQRLPAIDLCTGPTGRKRKPADGIADAACLALFGRRGA